MTAEYPALTARSMIKSLSFTFTPAPSVVLLYDASLVPSRASTRRHRRATHPFREVASISDGVDVVVAAGPGAPVAAITVEFLAAMGVRSVIAVGSAGMLDVAPERIPATRHVVVEQAESDEGTSMYYGTNLGADPTLTASLASSLASPTVVALTTDVPFRHTPERLAQHRERADVVEMECAAFLAAANCFEMAAGAALVISDVFQGDEWSLVVDDERSLSFQRAVDAAVSVLEQQ